MPDHPPVDWATADWAAAVGGLWADLPPAPGADGTVSLAVAIAPRKEVSFHWTYRDGSAVAGGPGPGGEPDLVLGLGPADGSDVFSGRVEPSVAFMRGRLKATGAGGLLLAFLASTTAPGFEGWRSKVAKAGSLPG